MLRSRPTALVASLVLFDQLVPVSDLYKPGWRSTVIVNGKFQNRKGIAITCGISADSLGGNFDRKEGRFQFGKSSFRNSRLFLRNGPQVVSGSPESESEGSYGNGGESADASEHGFTALIHDPRYKSGINTICAFLFGMAIGGVILAAICTLTIATGPRISPQQKNDTKKRYGVNPPAPHDSPD